MLRVRELGGVAVRTLRNLDYQASRHVRAPKVVSQEPREGPCPPTIGEPARRASFSSRAPFLMVQFILILSIIPYHPPVCDGRSISQRPCNMMYITILVRDTRGSVVSDTLHSYDLPRVSTLRKAKKAMRRICLCVLWQIHEAICCGFHLAFHLLLAHYL